MPNPSLRPRCIHILVYLRHFNIPPHLLLPSKIAPKPPIPIIQRLLKVRYLLFRRVTRHQLRFAQRQLITPIRLPQIIHLPIQMHYLFHLGVLGDFPGCFRDERWARHDQHTGFDFEDERVPELLLECVQCVEECSSDHVFWLALVDNAGM